MMRSDDPEFSSRKKKFFFQRVQFVAMDKFFFYCEVICRPESAYDDLIVFVTGRTPGFQELAEPLVGIEESLGQMKKRNVMISGYDEDRH